MADPTISGDGAFSRACEDAPGPRGHVPGACAAHLRDPAGNNGCSCTFV